MHRSIVLEPPPLAYPGELRDLMRESRRARRSRAARELGAPDIDECYHGRGVPHEARRRAASMLEGLLRTRSAGTADLGRLIARHGTLQQLAVPGIAAMLTSSDRIVVPNWSGRLLLAALSELTHVALTATHRPARMTLYVAAEWDAGQLVVALASRGRHTAPVPSYSGSEALLRASGLARALGGELVRGMKDGGLLFGMTLQWPAAGGDDAIPF